MKYGFIPPIIEEQDFWLGSGKLGTTIINEKGDWIPYLPDFEYQNRGFETNACVTFATLSALEILDRFLYNFKSNYSDRFIAKLSGTDPKKGGNTPKKVAETIRHSGTIPESEYPFAPSLEEFYKEIPQNLIDKGVKWLTEFEVGYEWTDKTKLKEALKRSPVCVAVYAWQQNDKGEYIKLGSPNHYVVLVAFDKFDRPIIWDSYESKIKILEKDYELEYPQIYTLTKKKQEIEEHYQNKEYWFVEIFKRVFSLLPPVFNYLKDWIDGKPLGGLRSPKWNQIRKEFLKKNSICAGCGKKENLTVHHKLPFHLFPEKELLKENLIVLCEGSVVNCHFLFGHCFLNWQCYNENVEKDVQIITSLRNNAQFSNESVKNSS